MRRPEPLRPAQLHRADQPRLGFDPYSKLFKERIVFLGVQIDDVSANDVMAQLLYLESEDPDRDINIYINSPGGSFTALTAIYDTMMYIRPEVPTVCLGQAAARRPCCSRPAAGQAFRGAECPDPDSPALSEGGGQGSDIEIQANEIMRMRSLLEKMLADHTGAPKRRSKTTSTATRSSPRRRPSSTASSTRSSEVSQDDRVPDRGELTRR